ncbi:MAG: DNA primase, partial [SAR324 cluster bacterium]|nr:DNA primase [SAR324 cluster bacterium]
MLEKTGFISNDQKEQILKAVDIVQLVSGYVQLRPSGKNYLGLCPFHQEKTPSFTVSTTHQNYKCYGCGEYGDAIRFVMEMENFQFKEALQFLAVRNGIEIRIMHGAKAGPNIQSGIGNCLQLSFDFFRENLTKAAKDSSIHSYITNRLISDPLMTVFKLGYIGPGWTQLHHYLTARKINIQLQEKAGLIKAGEKGGYYDRLRDRLIFPIRDFQGKVLGFAGRSVGDGKPKYLNPPESDLYKKSAVLYGIYEARDDIRKKRRAIVVEGYLDVIRLHEQSWTETVATCGTALTAEHIHILKRLGTENVILLFDGDKAGIKAAEKSAILFLENELDSRVMILPDGLDPDDYFKKYNNKDFNILLDQARYDYEFIIDRTRERTEGTGIEFQKRAVEEILQVANGIQSEIKKELFLSQIASNFKIERGILNQIVRIRKKRVVADATVENKRSQPVLFEKSELPEAKFLQYLITHPQSIILARKYVVPSDFSRADSARLYARFLELSDQEFVYLKTQEFPEFFVEFNALVMFLLQYKIEYEGPAVLRKRDSSSVIDEEMVCLQKETENKIRSFSEESLRILIRRLKKKRAHAEIEKLTHTRGDQTRASALQLAEKRKRNITLF